jgi:hypothetical protein
MSTRTKSGDGGDALTTVTLLDADVYLGVIGGFFTRVQERVWESGREVRRAGQAS